MNGENLIDESSSSSKILSSSTKNLSIISKVIDPKKLELAKVYLGFIKNHSKTTGKEYARASMEFISYVKSIDDIQSPKDIKRHHIIDYRNMLKDKGAGNKTILKKLSALSSMCRHLAEEGLMDKDVMYGVKRPKTYNKKETSDLSDAEVKKIFDSLDPKKYNFVQYRAILAVGFFTGLRNSEIRHLKIKDIGEVKGHKVIRAIIKGDKPHEVVLNPFAVHCLNEQIARLKEMGFSVNGDHYLFPILKPMENKPYHSDGLRYIIKTCIKNAGIETSEFRRYSPHSMRATLAGNLLNTVGAPLEKVQKILGHASPTTTQKYNKREESHDLSPIYQVKY